MEIQVLVKTWIDALKQIHYVATNQFNEIVITSDGKNYLQKFDSDSLDDQLFRLNVLPESFNRYKIKLNI